MHVKSILTIGALAVAGFGVLGCGKATDSATPAAPASSVSEGGHSHDGWWCDEHGVPEEVCARCKVQLVAGFKAKGDWCKEHDVPDSQCFVCHPEKEAEFAAQYEAKYGTKPPKPGGDEGKKHDHDHDAKS